MAEIMDLATHQDKHVTLDELAEYWGVSKKALYRQWVKGALEGVQIGKQIRIPIATARTYGRPNQPGR